MSDAIFLVSENLLGAYHWRCLIHPVLPLPQQSTTRPRPARSRVMAHLILDKDKSIPLVGSFLVLEKSASRIYLEAIISV